MTNGARATPTTAWSVRSVIVPTLGIEPLATQA